MAYHQPINRKVAKVITTIDQPATMPLLVDYTKRRADINTLISSYTDQDDSNHSVSWSDSFACDDLLVEYNGQDSFGHGSSSSLGKVGDSLRTVSTTSASSVTSVDEATSAHASVGTTETPVSFRIKRCSMGMGGSSAAQQPQQQEISQSERFHGSMQDRRRRNSLPGSAAPYRRTATAPGRVNSGDSLEIRLHYAAWKQRKQNLLSAAAEIATSDDKNILDRRTLTRRLSMPFTGDGASRKRDIMGGEPTCPDRRRRCASMSHVHHPAAKTSEEDTLQDLKVCSMRNPHRSKMCTDPAKMSQSHTGYSSRRSSSTSAHGHPSYNRRRSVMGLSESFRGSSRRSSTGSECNPPPVRRGRRVSMGGGSHRQETAQLFQEKEQLEISIQQLNSIRQSTQKRLEQLMTQGKQPFQGIPRRSSMGSTPISSTPQRYSHRMTSRNSSQRTLMSNSYQGSLMGTSSKSFHGSSRGGGGMDYSRSTTRKASLPHNLNPDFVTGSRIRRWRSCTSFEILSLLDAA